MTDLRSALERYLGLRQELGHKYQHQARRLADFVAFMETRKATTITTKLAMECVRDTYWYPSACPELMQEAAQRLDQRWGAAP